MSEEKCKYCGGEIGYIGMPYGFTCLNRNCITHNDKEFIQELKQQLQTAKEENEKLTQQNKQMREALGKVKKDACCSNGDCEHCECDEDCFGYDAQQALNEVNNEK